MADRDTWVDGRFAEVRDQIEAQVGRLQRAGTDVQSAAAILADIPTTFSDLIDQVQNNGTADQKAKLQAYTEAYQAVKAVADAADISAEVQALRDLEV